MPALHKGYLSLFSDKGRRVHTIFLINEKTVKDIDPELLWLFEKDLRAVPAIEMQKALTALNVADHVSLLNEENLESFDEVIIPDNDELVEAMLSKFYPSITPTKESWFIRWGRKTVLSQRAPVVGATIAFADFDKDVMKKAFEISSKSSDWWRQVGVILFPLNAEPIIGFNCHLPDQQAPYINGDPRTCFKPGECIELSTAGHAEATVIAYAAKKGISLEGATMYVTTFPCPPCAWLIINAGIKKLYYCEGYSQLNAAETFREKNVSVIFVDIPE